MTNKIGGRRPLLLQISHPQVREFLAVPMRRPPLFFVPLAVCCVIALAAYLTSPKRYTSTTLILVETKQVPDDMIPKIVTQTERTRLATLKQEILSRTRLERVIKETDPYPQAGKEQPTPMNVLVESMRAATTVMVKGNDAFSIDYTHRDPKKAQAVADRLATLFIESTKADREKQVEDTHDFIESEVTQARQQLDEKEAELRRYKEKYMGALPEQLGANLSTLQRLQLEQQTVEQTIRGVNERQAFIQTSLASAAAGTGGEPAGPLSPAAEIAQLKSKLADLRSKYTDEHPDVRATRDRLARLEAQFPDLPPSTAAARTGGEPLSAQLQDVQSELAQLRAKRADLDRQVGLFQARVERTPQAEQQLMALTRDYQKLQQNYLLLVETKMKATMAQNMERWWSGVRFKVLDPANLPERPVFPKPIQFGLGGLFLGLLTGLGVCFLAEYVDRSIKSVTDLEQVLPYPVLGTVARVTPLGVTEGLVPTMAEAGGGPGGSFL
jgi:polysaccharide chain length determinant protein (PEP-CTERM system associated)